MSVEFKDYYATLGVTRQAGEDEIKKAFRKLARQYHPDTAKDKKNAEAKFKEINEAYEVLGDPQKRKKYDELGMDWQHAGQAPPQGRGRRPRHAGQAAGPGEFHFGGTGFSDFFEQFFGGGARGGNFNFPQGQPGFGQAPRTARGSDIEGDILVSLDEVMNGSTRTLSLQRYNPKTDQDETQTFKVRIPPGVHEGQSIRVAGLGDAGPGGGQSGDLYLRVRLEAHPDFRVRGSDLYQDVELAPWEAALGTSVEIATLGSGRIKLRVPAGTNPGQQLRVRGQGLPKGRTGKRGDLHVVIAIAIPKHLTAEEREQWERLAQISAFNPRK